MATDATFDNQLQALANATATFANGKDAAIKNTIITALGGSTQQSGGSSGGSGKTEGLFTYEGGNRIFYNGDGTVYFADYNLQLNEIAVVDGQIILDNIRDPELDSHLFATSTDNFTAAYLFVERG